ncbi:hypothetical protein F511_15652 [Dorcoceras hygrometricum]|uniref:Uncharacterized protein n=1 Tax=Dorcoceras hygrometricum TaxID=472368 RepID=A0A2Z7B177_9LAMI|nr:hypothetical protein F511_15652 [Dorcoceras hygrometricum]
MAFSLIQNTIQVNFDSVLSIFYEGMVAGSYSGIESADGLALMTSSVTSSYSADGLRDQSQESAGSLHPDARRSDVADEIQSQATVHQQMLFGDRIAKRCRLHKLIRQRFALALKIQQEDFALMNNQSQATVDPVATQRFPDASNTASSRRAYMNQLLLIN